MIAALLPVIGGVLEKAAQKFFPDPKDEMKRHELQAQLQMALIQQSSSIEQAAGEIVKAEAQSESWLTSSWRPLTMLVFVALIVARWLGWAAPGLSETEALKLWDIIHLGIGGYVVSRGIEKVVPSVADVLKKR